MRAYITRHGNLILVPETETEAFAAHQLVEKATRADGSPADPYVIPNVADVDELRQQ